MTQLSFLVLMTTLLLRAQLSFIPEGPPVFPNFGVLGVSSADKVRLNLLHVARPDGPPSVPCVVRAELVPAPTSFCTDCPPPALLAESALVLMPGQAGVLDYSPTLAAGVRQSLRAVLRPDGPPGRCRNVVATLEVFDVVTGRLSVLYGLLPDGPPVRLLPDGPPVRLLPDGPPSSGLLGITGLDTVRLNVVHVITPDGPPVIPEACTLQARFVGQPVCTDGCVSPVLMQTPLVLMPGQAGVLDYSPTLAAGVRQSLRAVLLPDGPPGRCRNVVATVEVFDRTSGRTFVLVPEGPPQLPDGPPQ